MPDPLVSVIMPTYNHAEFIGEALDSVIAQTYKNIEIIVIDNFSEDDTESIVSSKKDDRIRYIKFSNNGIIAASRNRGIEEAQGKYIAFIDSDDVWMKDKLDLQMNLFKKDPDVGLVGCQLGVISSESSYQDRVIGSKDKRAEGYIYDRMLNSNLIPSSSAIAKKEAVLDVGLLDESPDLRCAEDFDLWLRIARKYKVYYVFEVKGMYRIHAANNSSNTDSLEKAVAVIDKHVSHGWTDEKKANRAKANFCFHEGWSRIGEDSSTARKILIRALKLNYSNPRMFIVSSVGIFLTFVPFIFRFIHDNRIDKKISNLIMNPNNI